MNNLIDEPMLELFLNETYFQLDKIDVLIGNYYHCNKIKKSNIDEFFRILHTIKGSSSIMMYDNITNLIHSLEDLFDYFRLNTINEDLFKIVIEYTVLTNNFIKNQLDKLACGLVADGDSQFLINEIQELYKKFNIIKDDKKSEETDIKERFYIGYSSNSNNNDKSYKAIIKFKPFYGFENIRAFSLVKEISKSSYDISYIPHNIIDDENSLKLIQENGFNLFLKSSMKYEEFKNIFNKNPYIEDFKLFELNEEHDFNHNKIVEKIKIMQNSLQKKKYINSREVLMTVKMKDIDSLIESINCLFFNSNLYSKKIDSNYKFEIFLSSIISKINELKIESYQLRKVNFQNLFLKLSKTVYFTALKLNKKVKISFSGEDTLIDKNILDYLSDPLTHMVRNSIDHGIEDITSRKLLNKSEEGEIFLSISSNDKKIEIKLADDGSGIDFNKIYLKAIEKGLLRKDHSIVTKKQLFNLIFYPGFSTNDNVNEFSGRGVGLDIAAKNISLVGGELFVESKKTIGTTFFINIPQNIDIINCTIVKISKQRYIIPCKYIIEYLYYKNIDIEEFKKNNFEKINSITVFDLRSYFDKKTILDFKNCYFILIEFLNEKIYFVVDKIITEHKLFINSLPKFILNKSKLFSKYSILDDGKISLMIDFQNFFIEKGDIS